MTEVAKKPDFNRIPTNLTENEFNEFFLPHLSQAKKGPEPKISLFKTFNYILYFLYSGCQWKSLPIDKLENGCSEIHYTRVFCRFQSWTNDGSLVKSFEASVLLLKKKNYLNLQSSMVMVPLQ